MLKNVLTQRTAQHIMRFTKVDNDDTSVAKMIFHVGNIIPDDRCFEIFGLKR